MVTMDTETPKIIVYDGAFNRVEEIGDPASLSCTPRHMLTGTATIVLPSDHVHAGLLRRTTQGLSSITPGGSCCPG